MKRLLLVTLACLALFAIVFSTKLFAQRKDLPVASPKTLAWWRFEDGQVRTWLQARVGSNRARYTVTEDSTGNRNPLRTFNTNPYIYPPDTSPEFSDDVPAAEIQNQPNRQSIRLNGKQYLYTVNRNLDEVLQTTQPSPFTIEGMFKLAILPGNYDEKAQVVLCKMNSPSTQPTTTLTQELTDQFTGSTSQPNNTTRPTTSPTTNPSTKPTTEPVEIPFATDNLPNDHPQLPFVCIVGGRNGGVPINHFAVNILDRNRRIHSLISKSELTSNRWYAFALLSDGVSAQLYLCEVPGDYELQATTSIGPGLLRGRGIYNIGCGLIDDQHDSWFQGWIDEIRISAGKLSPDQFLGRGISNQPHRTPPPRNAQANLDYLPAVKGLADPSVLKVDNTYYLYGTQEQDGFPVYISTDLQHWRKGPTAFRKTKNTWGETRFWAPSVIRFRDKYYMFYSALGPLHDSGDRHSHRICIAKADKPEGPFENFVAPLPLNGKAVIDPSAFVDNDGKPYLYFVSDCSENVVSQIFVARLNDQLSAMEGEPFLCTQPTQVWEGILWNEAPSVFRTGDVYVLLYSAQFWHSGAYSCGYATSRSPLGPCSKNPENTMLTHYRDLRGTGSVCTVPAPDNKSTLIFFHAQGPPNSDRRDVYFDQLQIQPDERLGVSLQPKIWP